jgi:hypothetical protein
MKQMLKKLMILLLNTAKNAWIVCESTCSIN